MRIEIVLFDGYDELDALGPFEVLSTAAAAGAPFEVALVGAHGPGQVTGQWGSRLVVGEGLGRPDAVVVPGGGWLNRAPRGAWHEAESGVLPARLGELAPSLRWTASVCTGAFLLARAGLLAGRPATTNRNAVDELSDAGVDVLAARVVDAGPVVTAAGLSAGLDLGLWLTRREAGAELARRVAEGLEYTPVDDVRRVGTAEQHADPYA